MKYLSIFKSAGQSLPFILQWSLEWELCIKIFFLKYSKLKSLKKMLCQKRLYKNIHNSQLISENVKWIWRFTCCPSSIVRYFRYFMRIDIVRVQTCWWHVEENHMFTLNYMNKKTYPHTRWSYKLFFLNLKIHYFIKITSCGY